MKRSSLFLSFLLVASSHLCAQLRLPAIIGSNMVLQQNDSVSIWGWSGPGEKVYMTTGWDNRTDSTVTSNGAKWKIRIKTPGAGGPYTISIRSRATIQLDNIMIGEVWVCSGQSNMEWSYNNGEKDLRTEMPSAPVKEIRFFSTPRSTADAPQDNLVGQWVICDSNTIKSFSAVGYFFGKRLLQQLKVPVGLINTNWGGTPAEVWTPAPVIKEDQVLNNAAGKLKTYQWWPSAPGATYNAMIAPITDFSIAGAIWYQGEANTINNDTYTQLLTTMLKSWRKAWKKDFPFYYVQIAPYTYGRNNEGALVQEAQTKAMSYPNVGMVVVTDLIDSVTNIHPSHKREVGNRLAGWALAETYKQPGIAYRSPVYKSSTVKGNSLVLSFDNASGFHTKDGVVQGFYVSGATENWVAAEASIDKDKIIVRNKGLQQPVYVRYGFGNTIIGNLLSSDGLPVIPFRTDNWTVDQSPVVKPAN